MLPLLLPGDILSMLGGMSHLVKVSGLIQGMRVLLMRKRRTKQATSRLPLER